MIAEKHNRTCIQNSPTVQLLQIVFYSLVHRWRITNIVVTKCVGPEKPEKRVVFIGRGKVQSVLINKVRVVLKAKAKLQGAFVPDFQIFLGRHRKRPKIVSRGLIEKSEFVVIKCPNFGLVLRISCHVAAVLKVLPHERTFVEMTYFFRIASLVAERLVKSS